MYILKRKIADSVSTTDGALSIAHRSIPDSRTRPLSKTGCHCGQPLFASFVFLIRPAEIISMNTNHSNAESITQLNSQPNLTSPSQRTPCAEPENSKPLPENQRFMPENEPENRSVRFSMSEDHVLYDPEDPGPFSWKPRSPLDRLPAKEQRFIMELLQQYTYEQARAILSRARPLGLGINPSISALHGFYYRWRNDELAERLDMLDEQVSYIQGIAGKNDENFVDASIHLLKRRLLETSIAPTSKTAELRALFGILDRIKNTELAERRVRLAEQKAEQREPTSEPQ